MKLVVLLSRRDLGGLHFFRSLEYGLYFRGEPRTHFPEQRLKFEPANLSNGDESACLFPPSRSRPILGLPTPRLLLEWLLQNKVGHLMNFTQYSILNCKSPDKEKRRQDAHWHFRVMLLSGLIIPIALASQIFKAVSLLRDFSQKDCVILHHNNRSSLPAEMFWRLPVTLLGLVPLLNLDLSNSCSIQSFRIKHEVMFLTNSFLCPSVPTVRLYPPFLCYSLSNGKTSYSINHRVDVLKRN